MCITAADNLDRDMGKPFMLPPLTHTGVYEPESLRKTIAEAKRRFEEKGQVFNIMLIPASLLEVISAAMPCEHIVIDDRANYDYLYDKQELIDLRGRAFHAKKNHLNFFLANYEYEFLQLRPSMADEAMVFIQAFNKRKNLEDPHERELLTFEERAMQETFNHLDTVGYLSGVIRIGGHIEALSVGGHIGEDTISVHIEKANIEYRGLYQAINNEFCKSMPPEIKYINREEDMGIPGLRKAKLSYNPIELIEKYTIRLLS